jgi:phospholipase C
MARKHSLLGVAGLSLVLALCGWQSLATAQSSRPSPPAGLNQINHIIFLAQENRSFDSYFGELRQYWAQNGYPDQSFDGLPQFNPKTGPLPHYGPPPKNPSCDPAFPPPSACKIDHNSPFVDSFQLITQCIENAVPSWDASHVAWDLWDITGLKPAKLNGFPLTSAAWARLQHFNDIDGVRAMGYYEDNVLNYYYFMASNFATSDRWFNPMMARTAPNREYLIAGTSQGDVQPIWTNKKDSQFLTATTIFQELQNAGISWKIYINPVGTGCSGPPYDPKCLLQTSNVRFFQWGQTIPTQYPNNLGTIGVQNSDWDNDVLNGTLPAVAQIEPAGGAGLDEHPSASDGVPNRLQRGAQYVSSLINQIMVSSSWKDSVFILTYDEDGGLYDHVSPQKTVSPDGILPKDLEPGDVCFARGGPTCDFTYTGYRVPLLVVSPYTKPHYVSHTVADETAILKLIETRFNLPALTKRDVAQMDMTEFFDFNNPYWLNPPTPPAQRTDAACYLDKLP